MLATTAKRVIRQKKASIGVATKDTSHKLDLLPKSVNADKMTDEELKNHLLAGYQDALDGKKYTANEVFAEMKAKYNL